MSSGSFRISKPPSWEELTQSLGASTEQEPKTAAFKIQKGSTEKDIVSFPVVITLLSRPDPNDREIIHFEGRPLIHEEKVSGVLCLKPAGRPEEEKELDRWRLIIEPLTMRREVPIPQPAT